MPMVGNRLLREAIAQMGLEEVATRLNLPPASLEAFRMGERPVNDALLLKLIDLIDSLPKKQE